MMRAQKFAAALGLPIQYLTVEGTEEALERLLDRIERLMLLQTFERLLYGLKLSKELGGLDVCFTPNAIIFSYPYRYPN